MSLTDLARTLPRRQVKPAADGGLISSELIPAYVARRLDGDPKGYADSTVATVVWQILRHTETFQSFVMHFGATPAIWRYGDFVVTPLWEESAYRFVLLALDPTLPVESRPRFGTLPVPRADDLLRGFERWTRQMTPVADYGHHLVGSVRPEVVIEFDLVQGLDLLVAPMSLDVRYTAARPTPPFAIRDAAQSQDCSMGVYSQSSLHGSGVTTADHGIIQAGQYDVVDVQSNTVNAVQGIVRNPVLDAAFLKLNSYPNIPSPAGRTFLSGVAPNMQIRHEFYGAQSGPTPATITGWDRDLLTVQPWLQTRLYTQRVLQARDSGSSLIDANDRVVGFAFYNPSPFASSGGLGLDLGR